MTKLSEKFAYVPVGDGTYRRAIDDGDPYWANVSLLLPCDGTDTSTTFPDASYKNHAVTANGNAQVDNAIKKYGTGAALFDGTGDWLSIPYVDADFDWFDADHTIEAWVYTASSWSGWANVTNNAPCLIGRMQPSGQTNYWSFGPQNNGTLQFYYWNGAANRITSTGTMPTGEWVHIAFNYRHSDGAIKLYINGTNDGSGTKSGTPQSADESLIIGSMRSTSIPGSVDDIRITNGIARYPNNFTPPTAAHPTIPVGGHTLLHKLVSWWSLDEASGNRVDSHGSNDLTEVGTVGSTVGKVGSAVDATMGATTRLEKLTTVGMNTGENDWAVACWVNIDAIASTINTIVSLSTVLFNSNDDNAFWVDYRGGAYHDNAASEIGISVNDGTLYTFTYTGTPNSQTGCFSLGRMGSSNTGNDMYPLNGKIDETAFWNRVLHPDEVTALYNNGNGIPNIT